VAAVVVARQEPPAAPTSDLAVIELYTILAGRAELWLGPYSRFSWHHPGPIYFYVLWPFYALSGGRSAGVHAGAFALNLASIGLFVWLLGRTDRRTVSAAAFAGCALLVWRASDVLASPWNPHIALYPMLVLVVSCAGVVNGHVGLLPVVGFVASFVGQTHVGLLPAAFAASGLSVLAAGRAALRSGDGDELRRFAWSASATACVVAALWLMPLVETIRGPQGNLTALWQYFFVEQRAGQPFTQAFAAWAETLMGMLRPDFEVASGAPLRGAGRPWVRAAAVAQTLLLAGVAWGAVRSGQRFLAALAAILVVVSLVALWSATRIEDEIFDHALFWLTGVGVLGTATVVAACVQLTALDTRSAARAGMAAGVVTLVLAGGLGLGTLRAVAERSTPAPDEEAAGTLAREVVGYLRARGGPKPMILVDQDAWEVTAGVALQLRKAGLSFAIEPAWLDMFTPALAPGGDEALVLVIAGPRTAGELAGSPAHQRIAAIDGFEVYAGPAP
jgi:hypothetical protein